VNETLYQAAALILPLIFAIVFHEVAHGWTALALGDPTAKERKRLSLNPLRHVDPVGTIVLPGLLKLAGGPVFGWAKPVPVVKQRLRNPRVGMMIVAAAGPGSNFVMAALAAIALGLLAAGGSAPQPFSVGGFAVYSLFLFIQLNLFLALFNLLPIPPFDGSHIVEGLLPEPLAARYERLRPLGFPLVLGLLVVLPWLIPAFDPLSYLLDVPFGWLLAQFLSLAQAVAGG
jgi:Zn-dependent protease